MYVVAAAAAMQAVGSIVKGQSEANALNYQSQIQQQNAALSRQAAIANANRVSMMAGQKIGDIKANVGASGIDAHSGSALDIISASAGNAELDRQNVLNGGEVRAINYQNQASLDKTAAGNALTGSYYSAVGSVAGAAAKIYGYNTGGGDGSFFSGDGSNMMSNNYNAMNPTFYGGAGTLSDGNPYQFANAFKPASSTLLEADQ